MSHNVSLSLRCETIYGFFRSLVTIKVPHAGTPASGREGRHRREPEMKLGMFGYSKP